MRPSSELVESSFGDDKPNKSDILHNNIANSNDGTGALCNRAFLIKQSKQLPITQKTSPNLP